MNTYEFNVTLKSIGKNVDEAFENLLEQLKKDPEACITQDVIYTNVEKTVIKKDKIES